MTAEADRWTAYLNLQKLREGRILYGDAGKFGLGKSKTATFSSHRFLSCVLNSQFFRPM
jgi:hypothetical protein